MMHRLHSRSGRGPRLALAVTIAACLLAVPAPAAQAAPFAYVTAGSDPERHIAQFNADPGGLLAPLSPPTVAAPEFAGGLAVSPDGMSLYVTNHGGEEGTAGDSVHQYDIRPDGTLSPKRPFELAAGDGPIDLVMHPNGQSVYVANELGDSVSQYDVGPGGALSPKSPPTVTLQFFGNETEDVEVSPDGNSVYVVGAPGVSQFDVGPGGALSPKSPPSVHTGSQAVDLAMSPDGNSAYVTRCCVHAGNSSSASVLQYNADSSGRLSPKSPPTAISGARPTQIAVSPDGKSAYINDVLGSGVGAREYVLQYDVGSNGALSPKSPFRVAPGGENSNEIVVSPDGKSVYVVNFGYPEPGNISQFDVGADGRLSPKRPPTIDVHFPGKIAVSPPAMPATKEQCQHGGWREFGFKNQGRCVRFVKRNAREDCRAEREEIGRKAFREKYGSGKHHRRAMHRCVKEAIGAAR
jgi:6-phosphogluconolactonase (cycloisomerase 2 family)